MKIVIFTTGGTIDKIYFDAKNTYQVGGSAVDIILREANVAVDYEIIPLFRKDSLDMTDADRELIRDRIREHPGTHFLVTHGTDTMVESAKTVSVVKDKVIVFTGAMQPAHFKTTDANFNIGCAFGILAAAKPGVYLAVNGRLMDPFKARKNITANRFEEV